MLYILIPILAIISAFIAYSVYTNRQTRFAQKERAFELKQKHMNKTMDNIRNEIETIHKEIEDQQDKLEALKSGREIVDLT